MSFKELETVVLDRDLPKHGLRRGDLGAVVQVYRPDGLEVEFVTASGFGYRRRPRGQRSGPHFGPNPQAWRYLTQR